MMAIPRMTRVLVVEDDPSMRELYARLFSAWHGEGFSARYAENGEEALGVLAQGDSELVVLDWALPGISGPALVRALRADPRTRSLGVLMVTGRDDVQDEVAALEAGSDDHLAKPFDERQLLARLCSLRRRRDLAFAHHIMQSCSGVEFDPQTGRVVIDGAPARLTPKEFDLFGVFLRRPGILHTASFLWESVWGYESDNWEHVLVATLSSLRRKLGPRWGPRLKVQRGRGYHLDVL